MEIRVLAALLVSSSALGAVITVSPADGPTAYTKIEAAMPGDEVVIAPGTYAFRVYLTAAAPANQPIYIHGADPANPPVWDLDGGYVEDFPGSYGAGDNGRGCWQVSGGTNYQIEGIVFQNCRGGGSSLYDSAGLRYYNGAQGLRIVNCLFRENDNGLTGGSQDSDATVEFSEFDRNGNNLASSSGPTHNVYIYGGTFALRYSYLHDPTQAQNLHCRAVNSVVEYNWFDRAADYAGDLMTSDDYAANPTGALTQTMVLRGNVLIETGAELNDSQMWAVYNDEASGSPVSFVIQAIDNTVVGSGGHDAFIHLSNADATVMTANLFNNIVSGTSQPILVEDTAMATVTGSNNWFDTGANVQAGLTGSLMGTAPGYADAGVYDFTLVAGSPCIGAGDTAVSGLPVAEYYENETVTRMYRVRATAMDLGAFEHTTTGQGIGPDGGIVVTPDAGTGAPDAGMSQPDAGGGTPRDSGSPGGDGGSGADAGSTAKSGCGCGSGTSGWPAALLALLLLASAPRSPGFTRRHRARRGCGEA